jgi:DNA-binding winged helix-turn-helix (wHTH) protein
MMDTETASKEVSAPIPASERFYRLGNVIIDRDTRCLMREGEVTRLEPRVFALLTYLVNNPGREISRQELGAQVWNGVTVVDEAIQRAVSILRGALGDSPKLALYIQTTAGGGYRLTCDAAAVPTNRSVSPATRQLVMVGGAGLLLGILAMSWYASLAPVTPEPSFAPAAPVAYAPDRPSAPTPEAPPAP